MDNQPIVVNPQDANDDSIATNRPPIIKQILAKAAEGLTPQEIVSAHPSLTLDDVFAAFSYAAKHVDIDKDGVSGNTHQQSTPTIPGVDTLEPVTPKKPANLDLNKILVVDDTPLNLEFMKAIFMKEEDYTLSLANDGPEGLAKAKSEAPFLIITDIMMPGMSGLKLCELLQKDPQTKDAAVIFITAFGQNTNMVSKGLDLGANDFITRPFEPEELLARVRAVARLKRAELEAQRQAQIAAQRNQGLELLNELAVAATSSLSLDMIFTSSLHQLAHLLSAEAVAILLINKDSPELMANITGHTGRSISVPYKVETPAPVMELTLQKETPEIIQNILASPHNGEDIAPVNDPNDVVSMPMISQEGVIGTIAIISKQDHNFSTADWSLLNSAISIITVAVENARLFTQAKDFNRQLEQKVRERTSELNQEKKKVEAILVSMADSVLVLDEADRITTLNTAAQKLLGASVNHLVGLTVDSTQLNTPIWDAIRELTNDPEPIASTSIDIPDPTQPGGALALQVNSANVYNEVGATIGTVIVLSDVTAIVEVERMKARFMAGVTHELKTPLAVIKLHTNNLASYHDRLPEAKRTSMLAAVQTQVKLLESLIEDILELSRFDASLSKIERDPVNVLEVIAEVIAESSPLALEKNINIEQIKPTANATIQGDRNKLDWLIGNLVDNAIKYTPNQGSVRVQVEEDTLNGQPSVVIKVSDTGIGIPPEDHDRIFERFYRVDSSHTIPGTGLGLSIVKEIAHAHDGTVSVASPDTGGSIFTVVLPKQEL
ncbi:MAG: ATP-binding protein [Chloroflexota bacterium]